MEKKTRLILPGIPISDWCGCSLNGTLYIFGTRSRFLQDDDSCIGYWKISSRKITWWKLIPASTFYVKQCFPLENDKILVMSRQKEYYIYDIKKNEFSHLNIRYKSNLTAAAVAQDRIFFLGDCYFDEDNANISFKYGLYNIVKQLWETPITYIGSGSTASRKRINFSTWNFNAVVYRKRWVIFFFRHIKDWRSFAFDLQRKDLILSKYVLSNWGHFWRAGVIRNHLVIENNWDESKYIDLTYFLPNWSIIGHLIILRKLLEAKRAHVIDENFIKDSNRHEESTLDNVITKGLVYVWRKLTTVKRPAAIDNDYKMKLQEHQKFVPYFIIQKFITDVDLDVFRNILSFLIHK